MRFIEFKLTETVEAMQFINRMSQQVVDYFNANPGLVKDGTLVDLDKIITDKFTDPSLEAMRRLVQISIEPMSSFKMNQHGRWELRLPGGSMSSIFVDPNDINPKTNKPSVVGAGDPAWNWARGDRYWDKRGLPQDYIASQIGQGSKLTMHLPAEVLTRSMEGGEFQKRLGKSARNMQQWNNDYATSIKSTIAHELNHSYNSLQGMDLHKTRRAVEKNKSMQMREPEWKEMVANADDEAYLNKNLKLFNDPYAPKSVKELYTVSRELIDTRKHFRQIEYTIEINEKNRIPALERSLASATDPMNKESYAEQLKRFQDQTEQLKIQAKEQRDYIKKLAVRQAQLKTAVSKLAHDPNKPTSYEGDAYWNSPTELNSRLQQASEQMAKEIKPGMTNQAIYELIQKAFGDNQITVEFMDPDKMKSWRIPNEIPDREFKQLFQNPEAWNKLQPEFKQEAFNSALTKPEFKRFVNIAYKFIQAEQANPISLAKTTDVTLGQKLKAALIGVPQNQIPDTILPTAKDAVISGVRQAVTSGSPQKNNLVAATVEASKKLDTPAALKTLEVGGKVLIAAGIVAEVYRGLEQISALPDTLTDEQYQTEVEKIIAKLVAEFGLVYVGALAGAWLSGVALSAVLPGVGTVAGAVVGFIAGGAAGYLALEFAGDSVRSIAEKIVTVMRANKQPKISGKQGAANARNAVRNFSTAGNPSPATELTPSLYESLDRIIELSAVKKPT
jgi:hypothetical protein